MMNNYLKNKITTISFLLMIMVVNIHSYNLLPIIPKGYNTFIQDLFSQGFSRIAVPLFFIISGYLFFLNIKEGSSLFRTPGCCRGERAVHDAGTGHSNVCSSAHVARLTQSRTAVGRIQRLGRFLPARG